MRTMTLEELIRDAVRDRVGLYRKFELQERQEMGTGKDWKDRADLLQEWLNKDN